MSNEKLVEKAREFLDEHHAKLWSPTVDDMADFAATIVSEREAWKGDTGLIHNSFTATAPLIGKGTPYEIFFLALAMTGEAGEVANVLKKSWRGDYPLESIKEELSLELADVRIYLEHLARESGIDLDAACNAKVEKLKARWPGRVESGKEQG